MNYGNNIWLMDIGFTLEFGFLLYFFNKFITFGKSQIIAFSILLLYLLVVLVEKYWDLKLSVSVNYILPVVIIGTIAMCGIVIIKTFEKNAIEFNKSYLFWIAFAKLFYLMMILPFNVFGYLALYFEANLSFLYYKIDSGFNFIANIILNFIFAYSFKCRK